MRCISCGFQISDAKRMCDQCTVKFVERLAKDQKEKERAKQDSSVWRPPAGAPAGVVKTWKPQKRKKQNLIKGGLSQDHS